MSKEGTQFYAIHNMRWLVRVITCGALVISPTVLAEGAKTRLSPTSKGPDLQGPDIVLIEQEDRQVYEYRQNDKLMAIKVVPKNGKPYYLVAENPTKYGGDLERAERLVPRWVIKKF